MMKKFVVLLATVMLAVPVASFAAVANDEVTSVKLKEADGTSGQNTNSGSGVKTNHLQDAAVTSPKIANGAITDAKISGTLSTSKLNVGTAAGTVAAGDHTHDAVYAKKSANVVVVAKSGGDFADIVTAINSITDASATNPYLLKLMPGVYNVGSVNLLVPPYVEIEGSGEIVTKITASGNSELVTCNQNTSLRFLTIENTAGPGIKAYGGSDNNYVDLKNITVFAKDIGIYAVSGKVLMSSIKVDVSRLNAVDVSGILNAAQEVTMHDVTALVSGTTGGSSAYAINNWYVGNVVMNNVTAIASASPGVTNYAVFNFNSSGNISVTDSTLKALGSYNTYGIFNYGNANTTVSNTKVITEDPAGIGVSNVGLHNTGVLRVDHSEIKGSRSVLNNPNGLAFISYSKLDGGPIYGAEPYPAVGVKCIGTYDGDYNPYACQ